jgi:YD repeat-containing protein
MTEPTQVVVTPLGQAVVVQINQQAVAELAQTFETLAQNIKGLPFALERDAQGRVLAVVYAGGQIVKTLQRNAAGQLAAVVLSGTALGQRVLTKQLLRTEAGVLNGTAYEVTP